MSSADQIYQAFLIKDNDLTLAASSLLLDYAAASDSKELVFISDNYKDFGDSKSNYLHPDLIKEAKELPVTIHYFQNFDEFIKNVASAIDYIDEKWIKENIDNQALNALIKSKVQISELQLKDSIQDNLELNQELTNYLASTDYVHTWIKSFYVYELINKDIVLNVSLEAELEYEYEYVERKEVDRSSMSLKYKYDRDGNPKPEVEFIPRLALEEELSYSAYYPIVLINLNVIIRDKKIVEYEFEDWDYG